MSFRTFLVAAVALAAMGSSAYAADASFTETVNASGSIGSATFNGAELLFTGVGPEPAQAGLVADYGINLSSLTVSGASSLGQFSVSFSGPVYIFEAYDGAVGFNYDKGEDIIDTLTPAFAGYQLTAPFGPVSGSFVGNYNVAFATSGGDFTIDTVDSSVVFEATSAAPEPSAWALMIAGAGLAGGALRLSRRGMLPMSGDIAMGA